MDLSPTSTKQPNPEAGAHDSIALNRSAMICFAAGVLISFAVFLVRLSIHPVMGQQARFGLGIVGIVVAAYFFRFWGGIAATLGMIGLGETILSNPNRFFDRNPSSVTALLILFLAGLSISIACERLGRALDRLVDREKRAVVSASETARAYGMLYSVLDHAPMIVAFFDVEGRISRINSGSKLPVDSWVGHTAQELFGQHGPLIEQTVINVLNSNEPSGYIEFAWSQEGAEPYWFTSTFAPVQEDVDGNPSVCMIAMDLSERKAVELDRERALQIERHARSEAEKASRMKDEFVATLSHELRTPLTSILGWADLMRFRGRDPEVVANGVEAIERSGRSQLQMVEDLLDLNRINSGKLTLEKAWCGADEIIESAVAALQISAKSKGIQIHCEPSHDIEIYADPARVQQVLTNLISNAIKFSPPETTIVATVSLDRDGVRFRVIDQGEGIDRNFLPHVFDRFRQGDSTMARRHGGLGLGLAIVKQLVEMHGGAVEARSAGKGKGASFSFWIPGSEESKSTPWKTAVDRSIHFESNVLEGIEVLIVEDDEFTQVVLRELLEGHGATVRSESDAVSGLKELKRKRPHIVLSDIGMPGVDGYEFLKRIRALSPNDGGNVPVIALTAFARIEDRREALAAGFHAHVTKPIDVFEVVSHVRNLSGSRTS